MIALTLAEVAAATGGRLSGATGTEVVTSVVIDSRAAAASSLFVALPGEHADGHAFAQAAVEAGAVGVLAARELGLPSVIVDDVTRALGLLAHAVLVRLPAVTVIGITGSSGKTTTKDLLAGLLEPEGPTVAPVGSYNNEIGLPLTVLEADETTRFLVLEYSARAVGHIAYLCGIARPDIAVELNVGVAHLGEFGSRQAIAQAKGELVEALAPDGLAVLNGDDPLVVGLTSRTTARVQAFGAEGDVRAEDIALDGGRARFTLVAGGARVPVALELLGTHMVSNALAAASVALAVGLSPAAVAGRLSMARPRSRWRMDVAERPDGVTIVNDAYNANPESVRAALETLVSLAGPRRSWAVLGEMAELGASSAEAHHETGALAARLGVSRVLAVGAPAVHDGASAEGADSAEVPDIDAALTLLRAELEPSDVVLVKGSRSAGLDRLATGLLSDVPAGAAR